MGYPWETAQSAIENIRFILKRKAEANTLRVIVIKVEAEGMAVCEMHQEGKLEWEKRSQGWGAHTFKRKKSMLRKDLLWTPRCSLQSPEWCTRWNDQVLGIDFSVNPHLKWVGNLCSCNKSICSKDTAFCGLYHLCRWISNSSYLGSWSITLFHDIEYPNLT